MFPKLHVATNSPPILAKHNPDINYQQALNAKIIALKIKIGADHFQYKQLTFTAINAACIDNNNWTLASQF